MSKEGSHRTFSRRQIIRDAIAVTATAALVAIGAKTVYENGRNKTPNLTSLPTPEATPHISEEAKARFNSFVSEYVDSSHDSAFWRSMAIEVNTGAGNRIKEEELDNGFKLSVTPEKGDTSVLEYIYLRKTETGLENYQVLNLYLDADMKVSEESGIVREIFPEASNVENAFKHVVKIDASGLQIEEVGSIYQASVKKQTDKVVESAVVNGAGVVKIYRYEEDPFVPPAPARTPQIF